MSLAELLVAMLVGAVILQGALGFFISQSRLVGENESRRTARTAARSAMNVFMADLRRVETGNGIISASGSAVEVRVPFALGIVCSSSTGLLGVLGASTTLSLLPTDSVRLSGALDDGLAGFATRNGSGTYAGFTAATDLVPGDPDDCTSNGVAVFNSRYVVQPKPDLGAPVGSQVLLYDRIRYEFDASDGGLVLTRTVNDGVEEELVGPFDAEDTRFRFYAAGSAVASDAPPATLGDIRGLEIVLIGQGDRPRPGSTTRAKAPLTASVFFKNRPS